MMTGAEPRRRSLILRCVKLMAALLVLAVAAAVPAVYFGLPLLARTKRARARVEKCLGRTLGTKVTVGKMEASWRDGITLKEVSCGPAAYGGVEITAGIGEANLRPDYGRLLRGRLRADVSMAGPHVRLRELAEPAGAARARLPRICRSGFRIRNLTVRRGSVSIEDASGSALRMEGLDLAGAVAGSRDRIDVEVTRLDAGLNGGRLTGGGVFAISPGCAKSRVDVVGTGMEANPAVSRIMRLAVPLFETAPGGSVRGRIDLRFKAEGEGKDVRAMLRSARGGGAFALRGGEIRGSRFLEAVGRSIGGAAAAVHEVEGPIAIRDGRFHVSDAVARGAGELRLRGWLDIDGALEYSVDVPGAGGLVHVTGTLADPRAASGPARPGEPF